MRDPIEGGEEGLPISYQELRRINPCSAREKQQTMLLSRGATEPTTKNFIVKKIGKIKKVGQHVQAYYKRIGLQAKLKI